MEYPSEKTNGSGGTVNKVDRTPVIKTSKFWVIVSFIEFGIILALLMM